MSRSSGAMPRPCRWRIDLPRCSDRLSRFAYLSIMPTIKDAAIGLSRSRRVKLPDAQIAATALAHGLSLMTPDADLMIHFSGYDMIADH